MAAGGVNDFITLRKYALFTYYFLRVNRHIERWIVVFTFSVISIVKTTVKNSSKYFNIYNIKKTKKLLT